MTDRMTDPTTPRPDPVTEARDALAKRWPLTMTQQTCCPYPHGPDSAADDVYPAHHRTAEARTDPSFAADLDNLIALARAEAGVSVEALAVPSADDLFMALQDAVRGRWGKSDREIAEWMHGYLAARSAGSGSRVEATHMHAGGGLCSIDHDRPTPPPAMDGTRVCGHQRAEDGICGHTEGWSGHHSEAIVGGIHQFVPFTPPTPSPAVDGTRAMVPAWMLVRTYSLLPADRAHLVDEGVSEAIEQYLDEGIGTPPAPDPDRLRALEAALAWAVDALAAVDAGQAMDLHLRPSVLRPWLTRARALLADGERSE